MVQRLLVTVTLFSVSAAMVWAGCKSDCREAYESAVDSCKVLYDQPDDADDLQQCIQSAKDDYDSCIEECDE